METREKGRKTILANGHALPALAATLERLAGLDVTTRRSGPRYDFKNEKAYTRYIRAQEVVDRCLKIIGWCDITLRESEKSSRNKTSLDHDMDILKMQWEYMDSCMRK